MLNKHQIIQKCRSLLIDTGPLSLLLVGLYDVKYLSKFSVKDKRFEESDFDLLINFLKGFELYVTPHVLAEAFNVIDNELGSSRYKQLIGKCMLLIKDGLLELYVNKNVIVASAPFLKFGITDAALFLASENKILITADWPLRNYCHSKHTAALHLDEITSPKFFFER